MACSKAGLSTHCSASGKTAGNSPPQPRTVPTRQEREKTSESTKETSDAKRNANRKYPSREKGDGNHCVEFSANFSSGMKKSPTTEAQTKQRNWNGAHQWTSRRNKGSDLFGRTGRSDSDHPFGESRDHPESAKRMDKTRTAKGLQKKIESLSLTAVYQPVSTDGPKRSRDTETMSKT